MLSKDENIVEKQKGYKFLEKVMISLSILLICILIFVDNSNINSKVTVKSNNSFQNTESVVYKININSANVEELATLSGIGEKKAQSIIDYRNKYGKFKSKKDIKKVKGIGNVIYNNIKNYICI